MPTLLDITEIRKRVAAINLSLSGLARRAGVEPSVVLRGCAGKHEPKISTLRKIGDPLIAEEIRLRDYLLELHPVPNEDASQRGVG